MTTLKKPSRWQWLYAVALASTIVWASGHGQVAGPAIANFDKVAHFSVFGLLATLMMRPLPRKYQAWAIVIVSFFGATDEFHQGFTPGRSMDYLDWISDTTGAAMAVVSYAFWPLYRRVLETRLWPRNKSKDGVPSPPSKIVPIP